MAAATLSATSTTSSVKYQEPLAEAYHNSIVQEHLRATMIFNNFIPVLKLNEERERTESFGPYTTKAKEMLATLELQYLGLKGGFAERSEALLKDLDSFSAGVKERGNHLQNGTATDKPDPFQLQLERYEMLFKHHKVFVVAFHRVRELALQLDMSVTRCKGYIRAPAEEKAFLEQAPECHSEMKKAEEACKTYLAQLIEAHKAAVDLREKLAAKLFNDNTGTGYKWCIQRVHMIVENGGNPLPSGSRLVNKLTSPIIPPFPDKYPEQPKPVTPGEVPSTPPSGGLFATLLGRGSRPNSPAPGAATPPAVLSASLPPPAPTQEVQGGTNPLVTSST
jgi:hypothetical protein